MPKNTPAQRAARATANRKPAKLLTSSPTHSRQQQQQRQQWRRRQRRCECLSGGGMRTPLRQVVLDRSLQLIALAQPLVAVILRRDRDATRGFREAPANLSTAQGPSPEALLDASEPYFATRRRFDSAQLRTP